MNGTFKSAWAAVAIALAGLLLGGCVSRPQALENSVLRDVSDSRVVVERRWGPLGITSTINHRDARAILDALGAAAPEPQADAEPQRAPRAMVSPELAPEPRATQPVADPRVCFTDLAQIPRDAAGLIKRSQAVQRAFQRIWPCPSTGQRAGACPGWARDHPVPLAVGGCDAIGNMQWLPLELKICAGNCKDRWERRVYAPPQPADDQVADPAQE